MKNEHTEASMTQELRRLAEAVGENTRSRFDLDDSGWSLVGDDYEAQAYIAAANPAAILSLLDRLEAAEKDAARLDWLQEQSYKAPGLGWVARDSTTGRGYRLHQDAEGAVLVRVAIDRAIQKESGNGMV